MAEAVRRDSSGSTAWSRAVGMTGGQITRMIVLQIAVIGAAWLPARRVARLDVLDAIAIE